MNGAQGIANMANTMGLGGILNANIVGAEQARKHRTSGSKRIFHGMVEVNQVANGYIVNIGVKEGYEYETHIASSITEVNEIIATAIVAFRLEDKS